MNDRVHDNVDLELYNVTNSPISFIFFGGIHLNISKYIYISYVLDNNGNLLINTTDQSINNLVINKTNTNSLFYILTKTNEYNIVLEYDTTNTILYDLNGNTIYSFNSNSPHSLNDNYDFVNQQNTITCLDSSQNIIFSMLLDTYVNIIILYDSQNNSISSNLNQYNIKVNQYSNSKFSLNPFIFSYKNVTNSNNIFNIGSNIITCSYNNNVYTFVDNNNVQILQVNTSDSLFVFYSKYNNFFGYIIVDSNNNATIYNKSSTNLLSINNYVFFNIVFDKIYNKIYFVNNNKIKYLYIDQFN